MTFCFLNRVYELPVPRDRKDWLPDQGVDKMKQNPQKSCQLFGEGLLRPLAVYTI
jgi:hypothetical protein